MTMQQDYAIELTSESALESKIHKAWTIMAQRKISTHFIENESNPHITLFASQWVYQSKLQNIIKTVAQKEEPISLCFNSMGAVPFANNIAYLAAKPTFPLFNFHTKLGNSMLEEGVPVNHKYKPHSWIPFCPVAEKLPEVRMDVALAVLRELKLPFEGYGMFISVVRFYPFKELYSYKLETLV